MSLRERKKRQARQDIVAAARTLIQREGYANTRMRDIASAAEVSYQTLYNYFPTKGLILQALLSDNVRTLADEINTLVAGYSGNLLATLEAINLRRLDVIASDERDLWRIASIEILSSTAEASGLYNLIESTSHEVLQLLLSRAREYGELHVDAPVELLADTIFCLSQYNIDLYMLTPSITQTGAITHLQGQLTLLLEPHLN